MTAMSRNNDPPEVASYNYMDDITAKRISKADWIRMVLTEDEDYGRCVQLSLAHMVGEMPKEIHSIKIAPGQARDPNILAKELDMHASWHCQDMPGAQMFNLIAFYPDNGAGSRQRALPFQKTGHGNQIGLSTESPTEQGKTQMTMRHVENLASGYFRGHQINIETLVAIVREQRQDNRDLRRDIQESWGVVRQVLLDTAEIQHAHKMKELEFARATEERKMLFRVAPAAVNEIFGKQIIPQSVIDSQMMDSMIEKLDADKIKMAVAAGLITPEQAGYLAKRVLERDKKMEKDAAADAKAREVTNDLIRPSDVEGKDIV